MSLNSLSQDPTKGLVLERHSGEGRGDGCEENVEYSDDDGDEEEDDSDEDDEEEKEEDEERGTSMEGPSSSQDDYSEKPSEKTSGHVSLTLFKKKYCKFPPPVDANVERCDFPKRQGNPRKRRTKSSRMAKVGVN